MTITVTNTSQTLETILAAAGIESAMANRKLGKSFGLLFQNPSGADTIYCEIGQAATAANGYAIVPNRGELNISSESDVSRINLISSAASTNIVVVVS